MRLKKSLISCRLDEKSGQATIEYFILFVLIAWGAKSHYHSGFGKDPFVRQNEGIRPPPPVSALSLSSLPGKPERLNKTAPGEREQDKTV